MHKLVLWSKAGLVISGVCFITESLAHYWVRHNFKHPLVGVIEGLLTAICLSTVYVIMRSRQEQYLAQIQLYREQRQRYEEERKERQHQLREHLSSIMLLQPGTRVEKEVGEIVNILNEPSLPDDFAVQTYMRYGAKFHLW